MAWIGRDLCLTLLLKNLPAILNLGLPAANSYFSIFGDCWLGFRFFASFSFYCSKVLSTQIEKSILSFIPA